MITLSAQIRDQASKKVIGPVTHGLTIKSLPKDHSIEIAVAGGKVGCVKMTLNGKASHERIAPYVFGGDDAKLALADGSYKLAVSAYAADDREGKKSPVATLNAEFRVDRSPVAPLPEHDVIKGVCEYFSAPLSKIAKPLREANCKIIRGWYSINWDSLPSAKSFDDGMDYKNAGFKTIYCFTTKQPPRDAKRVREWVARAFEVGSKAVDYWEIGNEPNLNTVEDKRSEDRAYWIGTTRSHFDQVFAPAAEILKPKGATIIGPSISKDLKALADLVKWGLPQLAHFAGYHPYGYNAKEHVDYLKGASQICGPLKLALTEWNFHAADAGMWSRGIGTCWAAAKAYSSIACYYRGEYSSDPKRPASKHGIFDNDHNTRNPYYSTFKAME